MKKANAFLITLVCTSVCASGQTNALLSIDTCYARARQQYPLTAQSSLLEQSRDYTLSNLAIGYLPQLSIYGQATYQSDVTQLPIKLPTMDIPDPHRDQYKIYAEAVQPITDLITVSQQKQIAQVSTVVETDKLNVELYKLNERINQLFFGILLLDAQLGQISILEKDLQAGLTRTQAAIAQGIAFRSAADIISAELLRTRQRRIEISAGRKAFAKMLEKLTGIGIDDSTKLLPPSIPVAAEQNSRPELKLFESQKQVFAAQDKLIGSKTLPRLSLFLQTGYGRPGLNMLADEFDFYYIGGIRMQWNLSSFYTSNREHQIVKINQSLIDTQRQTFELNTNIQINQLQADIEKLQGIIAADNEIIALRQNIKQSYAAQLENGTSTTNDYILQVNAEDRARQDLLLHQVQLLQTQYACKNLMGY